MKVLHYSTLVEGGAAKSCLRLHEGLLKEGINSMFLTLSNSDGIEKSDDFQHYYKGFRKLFFEQKMMTYKIYSNIKLRNLPKLEESFKIPYSFIDITQHPFYEQADIINLHWVNAFLDYPSFFKYNRKPVVWTLHDMSPFSSGYHYEVNLNKDAYVKANKKYILLKYKALKGKKLTVVSPSRWLMEKSKESLTFRQFDHYHIPYGLDTRLFRPHDKKTARDILDLPKNSKILLFVSEVVTNERKGMQYLIEALKKIESNNKISFCTVGKKNHEHFNLKHIDFIELGSIKDQRLMALAYSASDLFVLPSIEDNLPNTLLESILCGTPVLGFNIGGVPEVIEHGRNGLICSKISSEALAQYIDNFLMGNYKFNSKLIASTAQEKFNLSVQAKKYISIYERLIKEYK